MRDKHLADLARVILKDPSAKVTFGGYDSYFHHVIVKGKKTVHINIARMESTPLGVMLACGLVFHEVGHIHTDGGKSPGLLGDFENIIEDVRIEDLSIKARPGTAFDLEAVATHYLQKGDLAVKDMPGALCAKAMAYGRGRILNQKAMALLEESANEFLDEAFGQTFIDEIEDILKFYPTLSSTEDSRAMAKKLEDLLLEEQKKQQQQNNQQQSQDQEQDQPSSQQQEDGSGGSQGQSTGGQGKDEEPRDNTEDPAQPPQGGGPGDEQDDQDQPEDPAPSVQDDSAGDNEEQEEKNPPQDGQGQQHKGQDDPDDQEDNPSAGNSSSSQGDGEGDGENVPGPSEDADSPSPDAGGSFGSGVGGDGSRCPTQEELEEMLATSTGYGDIAQLILKELEALAEQAQESSMYDEIPEWPEIGQLTSLRSPLDESDALVASSRMRSKLGRLLYSSKRCPVTYGTSGRKIATNRLVRMATGDPRIFQKKVEDPAPNSAVVIIEDTSGSMVNDNRYIIANKAAFALNTCLHSLQGVHCCTLEYSNKDRDDGSKADVTMVCNFGQKPRSENFNIRPFDGTPTDQAIWAARGLLLQRPEPRKILMILTDGCPNDRETTIGATNRTLKDGIEIVAIGIASDAVSYYWPNSKAIYDLSELPTAMFDMMKESLTRRAA